MVKEFDSVRNMIGALKPSYPVYCLRPDIIHQAVNQFLDQFPGRVLYAKFVTRQNAAKRKNAQVVQERYPPRNGRRR